MLRFGVIGIDARSIEIIIEMLDFLIAGDEEEAAGRGGQSLVVCPEMLSLRGGNAEGQMQFVHIII